MVLVDLVHHFHRRPSFQNPEKKQNENQGRKHRVCCTWMIRIIILNWFAIWWLTEKFLKRNVISISAGIGITAILKLSPESDEDLYIKLASNPGLKILYYLYHLVWVLNWIISCPLPQSTVHVNEMSSTVYCTVFTGRSGPFLLQDWRKRIKSIKLWIKSGYWSGPYGHWWGLTRIPPFLYNQIPYSSLVKSNDVKEPPIS